MPGGLAQAGPPGFFLWIAAILDSDQLDHDGTPSGLYKTCGIRKNVAEFLAINYQRVRPCQSRF